MSSQFGGSASTVTDQQGRYQLDWLDKSPKRWLIASAHGSDQPYYTSERTIDDSAGYEPMTVDFAMVKGVVVTGRMTDKATGRPVQAWVGLRRAARQSELVSRARFSIITREPAIRPMRYVPSMADGSFRLVVLPGKGFLVAFIQYQSDRFLPAGVPNKRMPGAPSDALDVHYDTVPFELFPSNFPAVKPIDIAPGTETITCDLTFDSGVVRTGTVRDQEGRPLSGTTMVGETLRNYYQFTSMDGPNFTVYGLFRDPKLYRTLIFRNAEKGLGKTLRIDGSDPGPIDVRLEPLGSLTGRLVDAAGKPRKRSHRQSTSDRRRAVCRCQWRIRHLPCEQILTRTDGSASTGSLRAPPTGCRHPRAKSSIAFSRPRPARSKNLGDITPKAAK